MKKLTFILLLLFNGSYAFSQNVGIGTSSPQAAFTVAAGKTSLFGSDTLGGGTKMMWIPQKSAFRSGFAQDNCWNFDSIGNYSFATGNATKAIGLSAIAMGWNAIARADFSVALGTSDALGNSSVAIGGGGTAYGRYSTSFCFGSSYGDYSISTGHYTISRGAFSTAMGGGTVAAGDYSSAIGMDVTARSYASTAIGCFNDSIATSSTSSWIGTDPVFTVGNGSSLTDRHNAMVVYKNGNTDHNGYTRLGGSTEAAPRIKMKELIITTPAAQGLFNSQAHNINPAKIIALSGLATVPGGYQILPNHEQAGFKYTLNIANGNIVIGTVSGNSGSILNAPVKILITYKE